jgi:hypothetical protein
VKELRLGSFTWPEEDSLIPEEIQDYYHKRVVAYTPASDPDEDFDREEFFEGYTLSAKTYGNGQKYHDDNIVVDILTSLCPNVGYLQATLGYFETFFFCGPDSLRALKRVTLRLYDTESGLDLHDLTGLFRAAPGITSMCLRQVSMEGDDPDSSGDEEDEDGQQFDCAKQELGVTLDNLTFLDLPYSAIGPRALSIILRACPKLETLGYEAAGGCIGSLQFTPWDAKNMILRYAPNLKTFRLDLSIDHFFQPEESRCVEAEEVLVSQGIKCVFDGM